WASRSAFRRLQRSPRAADNQRVTPTSPPLASVAQDVQQFATACGGVVALFFMGAIVYVLWRTLKMMPRTKPVQIKPHANQDIGWGETRRGADSTHQMAR